MFNNKLTKTLSKVNGFIDELTAGIVANGAQEEALEAKITVLENEQYALEQERVQAQKFINLLNGNN